MLDLIYKLDRFLHKVYKTVPKKSKPQGPTVLGKMLNLQVSGWPQLWRRQHAKGVGDLALWTHPQIRPNHSLNSERRHTMATQDRRGGTNWKEWRWKDQRVWREEEILGNKRVIEAWKDTRERETEKQRDPQNMCLCTFISMVNMMLQE